MSELRVRWSGVARIGALAALALIALRALPGLLAPPPPPPIAADVGLPRIAVTDRKPPSHPGRAAEPDGGRGRAARRVAISPPRALSRLAVRPGPAPAPAAPDPVASAAPAPPASAPSSPQPVVAPTPPPAPPPPPGDGSLEFAPH